MKKEDKLLEKYTEKQYNQFGKEYQKSRDEKQANRGFNEYLEMPSMFGAVKNIKGKKLLDIGCGAGLHLKVYIKRGAKCSGMDLSKTMIEMAKKNCPKADLKVGSMTSMPYMNSSFDIVTGSLCTGYFKNLGPVFKEVSRVLKKGGLFYFSDSALVRRRFGRYEAKDFKIKGVGEVLDKKTGKITIFQSPESRLVEWEAVPGMALKTYEKSFRDELKWMIANGLELVDMIDCYPTKGFKKQNPEDYPLYSKVPDFCIMVCRKK